MVKVEYFKEKKEQGALLLSSFLWGAGLWHLEPFSWPEASAQANTELSWKARVHIEETERVPCGPIASLVISTQMLSSVELRKMDTQSMRL